MNGSTVEQPESIPTPITGSNLYIQVAPTPMSRPKNESLSPAMTPLIGRESEILDLTERVLDPSTRLLTLTGPGGVGKTRLAVELFDRLSSAFPDRAWFIPLVSVFEPSLVPAELARAIAGTGLGAFTPHEAIARALGDERALVIVDNLEQIISSAPFFADLLAAFPQLQIVCTSREALRIRVERIYLVAPLALADAGTEAADLFLARVLANRPHFSASAADISAIPEICRRLDGLPLAIELAAARCRAISPATLLERMGSQLDVLTSGPRDLPDRQRTMRAAIAWSYDSLTVHERSLFDVLGVFAGSFSLETVEALWSTWNPNADQALDSMESLTVKSLLVSAPPDMSGGASRFSMLDTLRAFALEQLRASGRLDEARALHADWFLQLAETSVPELTGPLRSAWLDRLSIELSNFRVAQAWSLDRGDAERSLRFIEGLWRFWEPRGHMQEGEAYALQAISLPNEETDPKLRAAALYGAGVMPFRLGNFDVAQRLLEKCLETFRFLGDEDGIARGLNGCGLVAFEQGMFEAAEAAHLEGLRLGERLNDPTRISTTCTNLGLLYVEQGRLDDAWATYQRGYEINMGPHRVYDLAFSLNGLGIVLHRRGDFAGAIQKFNAAIEIRRQDRDSGALAASLTNLGAVTFDQGEIEQAIVLFTESLAIRWNRGELRGTNEALAGITRVAVASWRSDVAARFYGAVRALSDRGQRLPRFVESDLEQSRLTLQRSMGDSQFNQAVEIGRTTPLGEIIDEALTFTVITRQTRELPQAVDSPLTSREIEVIRLLAEGKSDREIGEELFISRNTVTRHVANIFLKLDINSRTLAAMYALQHGLVDSPE